MTTTDIAQECFPNPPDQPLAPPIIERDSPHANALRFAANAISVARAAGGVILGAYIARQEYPSRSAWPAITATALAASDHVDGRIARTAGPCTRTGKWLDQITDKIYTASVTTGVAIASIRNGRTAEGAAVAAAGTAALARDVWVTKERVAAEKSGNGVDTAAQWHGKAKTAMQLAALIGLTAPGMRSRTSHRLAAGGLVASAGLAVLSGLEYRKSLRAHNDSRK